jgi:hypothetical protein
MSNIKTNEDIYNVSKYTDTELYLVLDLSNPSDRELEARIYHLIKKYKTMDTESGNKLAQFFEDIYDRFFEIEEGEENIKESLDEEPTTNNNDSGSRIVTQLALTKDYINPLLQQTITRVVSIDSQFRNNKKKTLSTNFSFNLSDTLRDVIAIRMSSIHIPKTWYTISKSYGANFFYIKGSSPGVNDGLHDYKISIDPGNYSQSDLITAITTSITNLKANNTDIDFANTGISYNANTCIATFNAHIKSIYNETDYYLNFNYFTYPKVGKEFGGYTSIPALLGYNDQTFDLGTINSVKDLSGTGHPTTDISSNGTYLGYTDNSETFNLNSSNNYFYIINYNGFVNGDAINYGDTIFNDSSYNTIKITSSLSNGTYTRLALVTDFSAQIQKCSYLWPGKCGIQRFYVDYPQHIAYTYSYFKFKLYLNKKTTTNAVNQKIVLVTPNDDNIWVGSQSCFHLDSSVNEISTIRASSEYSKSDFFIGNKVYFTVECDASGYHHTVNGVRDFSKNDVLVSIPSGEYILSDYINEINYAIRGADISNNHIFDPNYDPTVNFTNITGFYINSESWYRLRMRYYINKQFSIDAYLLEVSKSDYFSVDLSFNYSNYDVSKNTSGNCIVKGGTIYDFGGNYSVKSGDKLFTLKPNTIRTDVSFGNYYADPYVITYTGDTSNNMNALELKNILNDAVQTFYDPILDDYPLKYVFISYEITNKDGYIYIQWAINLRDVIVILNDDNYRIIFSDDSTDNVDGITNSWNYYLYLDTSYNLAYYPQAYADNFDVSYTDILNTDTIYQNLLTIKKEVNDTITLKAAKDGIIDVTGGNANDWTITIPPGTYSVNKIIDKMNLVFDTDEHWYGSFVYTKNNHVYFSINSGKVFNTKDYKLVFYDPYSFVRCFVGASSVRNTSWDTTIGWILGYRQLTEYLLSSEYLTPDVNNPGVSYYGDTTSLYTYNTTTDTATITGDTTVSVNLYNYFMIVLDDYTQSHLNDGLVTITPAENNAITSNYVNKSTTVCNPITGKKMFIGTTLLGNNRTTENQVYAANQILGAKNQTVQIYSPGPFVQDIFALLPLNTSNLQPGSVFVDTGSGLAKQTRTYFGPVNISRMTIKLINDRGDVVDLNGSDWSCSLECDQLYQQKSL